MYKTVILDDKGDVVLDESSNALIFVGNKGRNNEVICFSRAKGASTFDMLRVLMAIDDVKEKIYDQHPRLKLLYAIRDELIEKSAVIDLAALKEELKKHIEKETES